MKHPFQRESNDRDTVTTPFQRGLVAAIEKFTGKGARELSGRQLSALFGKSANHLSLIMNDGFVPSGQAVLEMAEVLGLGEPELAALILAAIETKAAKRSRDGFWLTEVLRLLRARTAEVKALRAFLDEEGALARFDATRARGGAKPRGRRRRRPA